MLDRWLVLVTAILSVVLVLTDVANYTILKIVAVNESQKDDLRELDRLLGHQIDYLRKVRSTGQVAEMIIGKDELHFVQQFLTQKGILNEISTQNITQEIHRERRAVLDTSNGEITLDLIQKKYLSFDDQTLLLFQMAKNSHNLLKYGRWQHQARVIGYASVSKKPILWIDAGIHAREWIAHSTALNIIWKLVHDSSYKTLLSQLDVIVVPNTNPDGYEYSRRRNRLWRKTRSKQTVSRYSDQCSGVDGNRNYPFHFGEEGVSHWPCQEIYCGPRAMSEPEVMGVVSAIMERKNETKGYIALHSFGQDILYPWGHKINEYPPDVEDLRAMAHGIAAAIRTVYGTKYQVSNSAAGLYPASGAADDWAKSIGIKYSFTFELSPTSIEPGFVLPEAHIPRVSREIMEGVIYMAKRLCVEEAGRLLNDMILSRPYQKELKSQRIGKDIFATDTVVDQTKFILATVYKLSKLDHERKSS
ncbi:hypothetical protein KIN20_011477 [Parelaphostrongylus tenuis]|uniref:Peptidase M14 domain-containing protein n=1 Tax=Parelaphostrongylus tenuis TaxID=148309 RepID=A0AAD5QPW2_PARTN|nr:hypothetical protein KIN20_011477 [Parelaphostrongylus tenuis]